MMVLTQRMVLPGMMGALRWLECELRCAILSAYAPPTRCPVLTSRIVLPAYAPHTQSPVLTLRIVEHLAGTAHRVVPHVCAMCGTDRVYRATRYPGVT
eukprot:1014159-Rhodomonas_salina.1